MISVNQVIAWNLRWLRLAKQMKQRELGELLGWSNQTVSDAERSFDGDRTRLFDAQEITELALALGVPIAALFLPPDDGDYQFPDHAGHQRDMGTLLQLALPDNDADDRSHGRVQGQVQLAGHPLAGR